MIDSVERDEHTGVLALPETVRAARALTQALGTAMRDMPLRRPLVVGGDCSMLLGILPALRQQVGVPIGLWFLDGHPDYLDGKASDTGVTADMVLALLTGSGADALVTLGGTRPMVEVSDVILLGHRSTNLDAGSAEELSRLPTELRRIDAATVAADPMGAGQQANAWLAGVEHGVWLHVDVDVLDSAAMPAVTYLQPNGLDWDELAAALTPLAQSPRLLGISIADFRPDLDPTGEFATRLVAPLTAPCGNGEDKHGRSTAIAGVMFAPSSYLPCDAV